MKINLICNIFNGDGFSSVGRQMANHLHNAGHEVRIDSQLPQDYLRQVSDTELLMINREYEEEMTTIMVSPPPMWRLKIADNPKHFIGYLVWEGDKIPKYWLQYMEDEEVNQIWCPSEHVKDAIFNTSNKFYTENKDRIKIIPHGVDTSLFKPSETQEERPFTFICNKGWRGTDWDRGGVQYLLKAYTKEFTNKDKVQLILKVNPAYLDNNFNFAHAMKNINVTKTKDSPDILYTDEYVDFKALKELYQQGDVFVCPTRAEGFNLPGLEAKACGLPTIQTGFGGQIDYMTQEVDAFIDFKLSEVKEDKLYEGIQWAKPNVNHLRQLMREFYTEGITQEMKDQCVQDAQRFSWNNVIKKIEKVLKEL